MRLNVITHSVFFDAPRGFICTIRYYLYRKLRKPTKKYPKSVKGERESDPRVRVDSTNVYLSKYLVCITFILILFKSTSDMFILQLLKNTQIGLSL